MRELRSGNANQAMMIEQHTPARRARLMGTREQVITMLENLGQYDHNDRGAHTVGMRR